MIICRLETELRTGGCQRTEKRAVKYYFLPPVFPFGEILTKEKIVKKSKHVENTYVNQNAYAQRILSVENLCG